MEVVLFSLLCVVTVRCLCGFDGCGVLCDVDVYQGSLLPCVAQLVQKYSQVRCMHRRTALYLKSHAQHACSPVCRSLYRATTAHAYARAGLPRGDHRMSVRGPWCNVV
jgi:hypothetical protein